MKSNLYVLRDTQLGRFNMPFWARSDQEAVVILIRSGIPKSIYEDTLLFKLAVFDDEASIDCEPLKVMQDKEGSVCIPVKLPPFPEGVANG